MKNESIVYEIPNTFCMLYQGFIYSVHFQFVVPCSCLVLTVQRVEDQQEEVQEEEEEGEEEEEEEEEEEVAGEQEQGLQLPEHSQAHQNVHEGVEPGEDQEEVKLVE